jgi:hypothetical protein
MPLRVFDQQGNALATADAGPEATPQRAPISATAAPR